MTWLLMHSLVLNLVFIDCIGFIYTDDELCFKMRSRKSVIYFQIFQQSQEETEDIQLKPWDAAPALEEGNLDTVSMVTAVAH